MKQVALFQLRLINGPNLTPAFYKSVWEGQVWCGPHVPRTQMTNYERLKKIIICGARKPTNRRIIEPDLARLEVKGCFTFIGFSQ